MSNENPFDIRPGRIRSPRAQHTRPFIVQALAAAKRAGAPINRSGNFAPTNRSQFGKGKVASIRANQLINSRSRRVIVKTRLVRHNGRTTPLGVHIIYLGREGVTLDKETGEWEGGQFFSSEQEPNLDNHDDVFEGRNDQVDAASFAERCNEDRHHFRFIISPEDAADLSDLKSFTRDLVHQMEVDLETHLDWVAVDHWNTEHPHVHLLVRGIDDKGNDLVISRDYISEGMRDRARHIATLELGPRTDLDIENTLAREVDAERWTKLDRQLTAQAETDGIIDLAPDKNEPSDKTRVFRIGRLRKLQSLGLSSEISPGQWIVHDEAEATLRELGERGDIIKRMHRALSDRGIEQGTGNYVLASQELDTPVIGRLVGRGLDNELKETAWAVVDGVDSRSHHIKLPSLDATGDSQTGAIVELRKFTDAKGNQRHAIAVRSDLDLNAQIEANGATWLDRQNIAREPVELSSSGFGAEVNDAKTRRAQHLVKQGLARQQAGRFVFNRNLIETLTHRELDHLGKQLAVETGRSFVRSSTGQYVSGIYSRRFDLSSGRFAMVDVMTDGGMGFQLVPWTPSIERKLGQQISGMMRPNGSVAWTMGRNRGIGI